MNAIFLRKLLYCNFAGPGHMGMPRHPPPGIPPYHGEHVPPYYPMVPPPGEKLPGAMPPQVHVPPVSAYFT